MSKLLVLEGVNLFVDNEPTSSKFLTLESMTLPNLEMETQDHNPGGSIVGLSLAMGTLKPLSSTFKLVGYDPLMMSHFGLNQRSKRSFTAYGNVRDVQTGREIKAMAVFAGRITRMEPDEQKRNEMVGHEWSIMEITHYEAYFDEQEKFFMDFFTQDWRIDGVVQNAASRRNLGIPGS